MLKEDLEKRLEDMEVKIEELEDCILDNRLRIMELAKKMEKKSGPELVKFEEPAAEEVEPEPKKPLFHKKEEEKEDDMPKEMDDFKTRARKKEEKPIIKRDVKPLIKPELTGKTIIKSVVRPDIKRKWNKGGNS